MNDAIHCAVIGHPVKHSRSPFIHERFARQFDLPLSYSRIDATPEAFEGAVRRFFSQGGRGMNVTLPHKQSAATLVSQLSPRAQRAGAVNTLSLLPDGSLAGDNTDGIGLVRDLIHHFGATVAGRRVLLLGAGGAARGALEPLLELQPRTLTIANRSADKAQALAQEFADRADLRGCGFADLQDGPYDLVINATAASLGNETLPLPAACVDAQSFCYDMVYAASDTPFVHGARQRGCARTAMGLGMLVEQAAESFFIWHGLRPDTAVVLAALKVELSLQD